MTNGEGQVDLRDSGCFVSGDALYRNPDTREALFPLGTYSIRELSAPGSYEPPSNAKPQTLVVTASGTANTTSRARSSHMAASSSRKHQFATTSHLPSGTWTRSDP